MDKVLCRFHNIQSHEDTAFELMPGLNFILADDNNVGKSTVFKVFTTMARMPRVDNTRLCELLREGTSQGSATFYLEKTVVTFWLFRKDANHVVAFFEEGPDASSKIRREACPVCLLEALDIVLDRNGNVINFNDADSVQLVVSDSQKNDEVLAHVLIDLDVERVKYNSYSLGKTITSDIQVLDARYSDAVQVLSKLSYNEDVGVFDAERELLMNVVPFVDNMQDVMKELQEAKDPPYTARDLELLNACISIGLGVDGALSELALPFVEVSEEELHLVHTVVDFLLAMGELDDVVPDMARIESKVSNLGILLNGLEALTKAGEQAKFLADTIHHEDVLIHSIASLYSQLQQSSEIVDCPIKGKVYYSNAECISVNNRPTHSYDKG